jgi:hypothetical protein
MSHKHYPKRNHILLAMLGLLICLSPFKTSAQTESSSRKNRHFVFYGGVGPNYYFNNLVLAKDHVNEFNYSFAGRIMWEPEYFLSLGLESGYYRLYTVNISQPTTVHIANSAIPIFAVVSMKFLKKFYANFSFGRSVLLNRVSTTDYGNFNANSISLADMALTLGYKRPLTDKISLGGETKFYYSSSANDKNLAILLMCSYRLK